jgi:hypothetical protein
MEFDVTPLDQLLEVALHNMEQRILLGFALNTGREDRSVSVMAPAESMAAAGVDDRKGENLTWAKAMIRLVKRGTVQQSRIVTSLCSIPVFSIADHKALPYAQAAKIRREMKPGRRLRRILSAGDPG